jgi:hypothetical protein
MIKKYNSFLLEKYKSNLLLLLEAEVYGSSDFIFKLQSLSKEKGKTGEIAQSINDIIDDKSYFSDSDVKQNFFDTTDKDDKLSFIMNSKVPEDWDPEENASLPYTMKGRGDVKIGKIIRYLVDLINSDSGDLGEVKDKDIENFVNAFKASKVDTSMSFKLVKGSDIAKYYNEKKYFSRTGSLGGSCMSDESKKTFEIYTENESKVQLLIYVDKDDMIHGRAIVWKLKDSPCGAKYFMDRVYINRDSDELRFKKFAEENEFLYKKKMNSYLSDNIEFVYKGKDVFGEVTVKLDGDFKYYPFVDTLCFLDEKKKQISNLPSEGNYILHSVSGDCDPCGECDGDIYTNDENDILCSECGAGHEKLKELGIETKINKNIK